MAGIGIGLVASAALVRVVANQLFQVSRVDPLTFTLTALALTVAALLANCIPGRRASKVNPVIALRYE